MVAEQPAATDSRPEPGVLRVALIATTGAPSHESLRAGLQREVVSVDIYSTDALSEPPPIDGGVVLAWMRPGASKEFYEQLVRWANTEERHNAVLGCAEQGTVDDSVTALSAGVDDFVAGRCSPRELAGRIRALVRRVRRPATRSSRRLRYGPMTLDAYGHELWVEGRRVRLTATELSVIRALIAARGRALSRAEILDLAWGDQNLEVGERAVDNVVLRLRRKIGRPRLIETVRGVGFRLAAK